MPTVVSDISAPPTTNGDGSPYKHECIHTGLTSKEQNETAFSHTVDMEPRRKTVTFKLDMNDTILSRSRKHCLNKSTKEITQTKHYFST